MKDNDLSITRDLDGSGDGWSDLEVDDIPAAGLGGGGGCRSRVRNSVLSHSPPQ